MILSCILLSYLLLFPLRNTAKSIPTMHKMPYHWHFTICASAQVHQLHRPHPLKVRRLPLSIKSGWIRGCVYKMLRISVEFLWFLDWFLLISLLISSDFSWFPLISGESIQDFFRFRPFGTFISWGMILLSYMHIDSISEVILLINYCNMRKYNYSGMKNILLQGMFLYTAWWVLN